MDRPRRALIEEPGDEPEETEDTDEPVAYVARRSGGFAPAEADEDTEIRPVRASRAFAPEPDFEPRPRRALPAEPGSQTPSKAVSELDASRLEAAEEWRRRAASFFAPPPQPATSPPSPPAQTTPAAQPDATTNEAVVVVPTEPDALPQTEPGPRMAPPPPVTTASAHRVAPIVVSRLVKSYNGMLAVRNLSFTVQPGRVTGFLGPNGAGKTTTLRILVGLVTPTTGTATFGSTTYAKLPRPQRSVGCVLDANFHPGRSGRNHLRVLAPTAGADDRRVDELLALVGLADVARRPAGEYSLGMRQRLALAAALLGDPDYLILDEPANGLDPEGIRWLGSLLRDFAEVGRVVLVSSHLLNEVQATADDIVVINRGRLLQQMPMSQLELGRGTAKARVSDLPAARRALAGISAQVEVGHDDQGEFLRVHSNEVAAVGAALFGAGVVVYELVTERRDLEQEFFAMLEEST